MERTPDEIKKGLECCSEDGCKSCPYEQDCYTTDGFSALSADALALIQQLQAENAEKDKSMQQLERSLSFACDLADGLKAATVKQEQELYVSEERNRQLETQNAELSGKIGQLEGKLDEAINDLHRAVNCPATLVACEFCKNNEVCPHDGTCDAVENDRWQWRGSYKEGKMMEVGYCLGLSLEAKAAYDKRISELEKENTELLEKVEQLQAERDAAVEALKNGDVCESCKHFGTLMDEEPCAWCGRLHSNFEWRGVTKEDGNG